MQNKTCYIFAAGDFCGDFSKNDGDLIIAADAGYFHLEKLGIIPDVLLGDFDTIGDVPAIADTVRFPIVKDYTDSALAVEEAIKRGYRRFVICGALGGKRLEHTLANIQILVKYTLLGYNIILTDARTCIRALHNSKLTYPPKKSGFISIFSHSDISYGVTIKGLKYTLDNGTLKNKEPLGVSNEFCSKPCEISVKDGTLLIITESNIWGE